MMNYDPNWRDRKHWPETKTFNMDGETVTYPCVYQDRLELEKEAKDNKELQWMLSEYKSHGKTVTISGYWPDGTYYNLPVIDELLYRKVTYDGFVVLHLTGPSNGGKSWFAITLAHRLNDVWDELRNIIGDTSYYFSYALVLNILNTFKKGDVVVIDEFSRQLGQDSASAATRFDNMLRLTRARGTSYYIVDPNEQSISNTDYMLRTAFMVKEVGLICCLCYTGKTHRLLGLVDYFVPIDEPWFKEMIGEYEEKKQQYLAEFASRGGAADKGLHDKQIRISTDLWKMIKERGMPTGKRGWAKRLDTYLTDLDYDSETYATRDQVKDRIIAHLEKIYNKDAKQFNFSIEFDPENVYSLGDYDYIPFPDRHIEHEPYAGQTENIRGAVLDRMIELGANKEIIEAFRIVRDAIDVDKFNVSEQFEQWQEMFPDSIIQEDSFRITRYYGMKNYSGAVRDGYGLAFEDVYSTMLNERGVDHIKAGGNTPEPDIIILDENGEPKEVHSVKCFLNKQGYENYNYDSIADSEKELGVPIKLIVLSLACGTVFEFEVNNDFIENGVRVVAKDGKSIRLPKGRPRTREEREDNEE